jgi:hydroxymethylbilane synthase
MTQSGWVAERIEGASSFRVERVEIRTTGDRIQDRPLHEIDGRGLFTRELDHALLDGEIDLAVHSLKDLPTVLPEGLALAAVPEREDARDVLIAPMGTGHTLEGLPQGARVGTGSLRRRALALGHRPDLEIAPIRGNLDTRVEKVDRGEYDAILLAAAGVRRLGWSDRISEALDTGSWLPAPGQGALAVVVREEDLDASRAWSEPLDDAPTRAAVAAERSVLHTLEAGCQLPVGALGIPYGGGMRLRAIVASPDGRRAVRHEASGRESDAVDLGREVAHRLLELGAGRILGGLPRKDGPSHPSPTV